MKNIIVDESSMYDSSQYDSNGFYVVNDRYIVLVIKEKSSVLLIGDYTEITAFLITKLAVEEVESVYGIDFTQFKSLSVETKIPMNDVLKIIAISKDPHIIKNIISTENSEHTDNN